MHKIHGSDATYSHNIKTNSWSKLFSCRFNQFDVKLTIHFFFRKTQIMTLKKREISLKDLLKCCHRFWKEQKTRKSKCIKGIWINVRLYEVTVTLLSFFYDLYCNEELKITNSEYTETNSVYYFKLNGLSVLIERTKKKWSTEQYYDSHTIKIDNLNSYLLMHQCTKINQHFIPLSHSVYAKNTALK